VTTYRVGNHQPQNVYRDDAYIGVMFAAYDAALVVHRLNAPIIDVDAHDTLINDLMTNIPESWGDDVAPESIVVNYVRELERRVKALGGSLERYPSPEVGIAEPLRDRRQAAREAFYDEIKSDERHGPTSTFFAIGTAIETATRVRITPEIIEAALHHSPSRTVAGRIRAAFTAAGFEVIE
jgi:hypothetical protein